MIVKKLRAQRNWSQEQLAQTSNLSLRTIQRIESGKKASLESLMSIASVLEVDIETLKQEIIIIDKESLVWKNTPLWVRVIFIGSNTIKFKRKDALILESICVVLSVLMLLGSIFHPTPSKASVLQICCIVAIFSAYYMSVKIRMGDKYSVW